MLIFRGSESAALSVAHSGGSKDTKFLLALWRPFFASILSPDFVANSVAHFVAHSVAHSVAHFVARLFSSAIVHFCLPWTLQRSSLFSALSLGAECRQGPVTTTMFHVVAAQTITVASKPAQLQRALANTENDNQYDNHNNHDSSGIHSSSAHTDDTDIDTITAYHINASHHAHDTSALRGHNKNTTPRRKPMPNTSTTKNNPTACTINSSANSGYQLPTQQQHDRH
jgi:hypothetical protein